MSRTRASRWRVVGVLAGALALLAGCKEECGCAEGDSGLPLAADVREVAYQPGCPSGVCDEGETCDSCPADCGKCVTPGFVKIKAGSFWMGSPDPWTSCPKGYPGYPNCPSEDGRKYDEDLHYVTLTHDFEMQVTEVTADEWMAEFDPTPEESCSGDEFNPMPACYTCGSASSAVNSSWWEACAYANEKSIRAGLAPCYVFRGTTYCRNGAAEEPPGPPDPGDYLYCMDAEHLGLAGAEIEVATLSGSPYDCEGFRLPTEAEWEYAARAGTLTAYHNGLESDFLHLECEVPFHLTDIAWYCGNNGPAPVCPFPVGQKAPNAWGLFDMSGNLAEWCFDQCGPYGSGTMAEPDKDPFGQEGLWLPGDRTGDCFPELKVTRGGSAVVSSQATWCRSAARLKEGDSSNVVGFRLVRTL